MSHYKRRHGSNYVNRALQLYHLKMNVLRANRQKFRHLKSRTSYRIENEYSPETLPQYFQITVNVLEARKLSWPNQSSYSSYVIMVLGNKKHRTTVKRNMEEPSYREYFVFDVYKSIREVQRSSLWFAVMEPRCYAPPRLLGESNVDLGSVWAQANHQVYHKWMQLNLPRGSSMGPVGFLKVDVSIVFRGEVQIMQAIISEEKSEENLMLPTGCEQQRANYVVTIYGAFGLPSVAGQDRRSNRQPSTYVKVSFCGLVAKTGIQNRSPNPIYCEQISLVEMFPNMDQVVQLEVCCADGCFSRVLASTQLQLPMISHDGDNGFLPTFGPSLLHMYGGPNGATTGFTNDDGPFYKGSILVAFKTIVPYYQQGIRNTSVESIPPLLTTNLWTAEDFCVLCPVFEISMLQHDLANKSFGVAITMGEIPCDKSVDDEISSMMREFKARKVHYTGSHEVQMTSQAYNYIDFGTGYKVLQLLTRLPDFRFRLYSNNLVNAVIVDLESCLTAVEKQLGESTYQSLIDELGKAIDDAAGNILKCLDIMQYSGQLIDDDVTQNQYTTELDQKQMVLQKEEMERIYRQITKKSSDTVGNLVHAVGGFSNQHTTDYMKKKNAKILLAEAKSLAQDLRTILFMHPEGWPDLIVWLLNGGTRVAYARVSIADIIYSVIPEQCGRQCGKIQTLFFKPTKCTKHINTASACFCVSGKAEILFWMGLVRQQSAFAVSLPEGYTLKQHNHEMTVMCPNTIMVEFRVFVCRAKFVQADSVKGSLGTFVRVNSMNVVKETKAKAKTASVVWNQALKFQRLTHMSPQRLRESPPVLLVEVLESRNVAEEQTALIGRFQIQPTAVEGESSHNTIPKLQWYEIYKGAEYTGQILMSIQLIQMPEKFIKMTSYVEDDSFDKFFNENTDPELKQVDTFESLPEFLIPKTTTYKVDIYWWGLRDVNITRKPCVVLELDDLTVKSDVIVDKRPNCNFPNGRTSESFEAVLSDFYTPSLNIKLYDSSTFGRTLFLGTKTVKNSTKYIVNWLSKNERNQSLYYASVTSNYFCQAGDTLMIRKYRKQEESEDTESTVSANSMSNIKEKPKIKKWFFRKEPLEEEFTLLPVYTKEKDKIKVVKKVSALEESCDWWSRFFRSLKIYNSELESQPEFEKFKDWCVAFKLYNGKKTGIPEKDEHLNCGTLKAGIVMYKWPPPHKTVAVTPSGVQLKQGYFSDYPRNDPTKHLIRIYIIRGLGLVPKDYSGKCDPYVIIDCGKRKLGDKNSYVANSVDPIFGRMYEFRGTLPEDYLLRVSLYDYEASSCDDLIGSTSIDLEDRVYSKHRAQVGMAAEYNRTGPSKWRDHQKPSVILEELCKKNHIPLPEYPDNASVYFNGIEYRDNLTGSNSTSTSDRKENLCLGILRKWHTLPVCGYHLVPEYVETRSLYHPNKLGIEQGKLQLWVDIFPLDRGVHIPAPRDVTPRKVEEYELRVIVWDVQVLVGHERALWKNIDVYVKIWIGSTDNTQFTDVHHISRSGEANFNWRLIFHFFYHHAERKIINMEQVSLIDYEESIAPILNVELLEYDGAGFLGSISLDLNAMPRGAKHRQRCSLQLMKSAQRVDLFALKSIRAWWPLKLPVGSVDDNIAGVIDLELTLLPKEQALLMPAGVGRSGPTSLPEPLREKSSYLKKCSNLCMNERRFCLSVFLLFGAVVISYGVYQGWMMFWTRYLLNTSQKRTPQCSRNNSNVIIEVISS